MLNNDNHLRIILTIDLLHISDFTLLLFSLCGERLNSMIIGYYALFLPCGQNNRQGLKGGKFPFLAGNIFCMI